QAPAPSPDGKRVAFSALTRIYVMDVPGGKPTLLSPEGAREYQPSWSPDGKWLTYVSWSPQGGHLWKRSSDGNAAPVQISRVPASYSEPVWSPDGKRIVVLRAPRREKLEKSFDEGPSAGTDLVWFSAEGGDANLILPARGASRPHFASDSERIYVTTPE